MVGKDMLQREGRCLGKAFEKHEVVFPVCPAVSCDIGLCALARLRVEPSRVSVEPGSRRKFDLNEQLGLRRIRQQVVNLVTCIQQAVDELLVISFTRLLKVQPPAPVMMPQLLSDVIHGLSAQGWVAAVETADHRIDEMLCIWVYARLAIGAPAQRRGNLRTFAAVGPILLTIGIVCAQRYGLW